MTRQRIIYIDQERDEHTGTTVRQSIFEAMLKGPRCIGQVARQLQLDKSCVSGRMNEFKKAEELYYLGKRYRVVFSHKGRDEVSLKEVSYFRIEPWTAPRLQQASLFPDTAQIKRRGVV